MLSIKLNFRNKILLALLALISGLFVAYLAVNLILINKQKKAGEVLYGDYSDYLTRTLEADNLENEEVFLRTIADYGVSILKEPKNDVVHAQIALGKFLARYQNSVFLTEEGKSEITKRYLVFEEQAQGDSNADQYMVWNMADSADDRPNIIKDALFFTLNSLKILKQSNSRMIKSVFIYEFDAACVVYPAGNRGAAPSPGELFQRFDQGASESPREQRLEYLNSNGDLVMSTRFFSQAEPRYDFIIGAVIDYRYLEENICAYAWKCNVDATVLVDSGGKVISCNYRTVIPELTGLEGRYLSVDPEGKPDLGIVDPDLLGKNTEGFFSFVSRGEEFYAAFASSPRSNWKLLFVTNTEEVDSRLAAIKKRLQKDHSGYLNSLEEMMFHNQLVLLVVLGIVFIFFLVMSLSISRRLTRSLAILNNGVERISSGDLRHRIPVLKTGDEIEQLISAFNTMVDRINRYIQDLAESIRARQAVESDIKIAAEIQASMLPHQLDLGNATNEIGLQVASTLVPSKYIAGDFYDYFLIDENRLFFAIGDVSGKGVPASLFMVIIKTLLKKEVLARKTGLIEILYNVNTAMARDNYSCTFVTLFCGILDLTTGRIDYVIAGHDMPIIVHARENRVLCPASPQQSTILGAIEEGVRLAEGRFDLDTNDMLILYTDGVTEAMDENSNLWGRDRLLETVSGNFTVSAEKLIEVIKAGIDAHTGKSAGQHDDITLLVLKRTL
jgi:serine phosphatase RsbU (regulator of sigma subunit)